MHADLTRQLNWFSQGSIFNSRLIQLNERRFCTAAQLQQVNFVVPFAALPKQHLPLTAAL